MKKTVKIERYKLAWIKDLLENLENAFVGNISVKLAVAASKNVQAIKAELDLVDSMPQTKMPEGFEDFERARMGIVEKHADKGEDGQVVRRVVDGREEAVFSTETARKAFAEEFEQLRLGHVELLEKVDAVGKARQEFSTDLAEVDLFTINVDSLEIRSEGKQNGFATYVVQALEPILEME